MVALHRAGRQADALAAYGQARTHLADELRPAAATAAPAAPHRRPRSHPIPDFCGLPPNQRSHPVRPRARPVGELLDRVRAVGVAVDLEVSSADGTPSDLGLRRRRPTVAPPSLTQVTSRSGSAAQPPCRTDRRPVSWPMSVPAGWRCWSPPSTRRAGR
jgi:hypothetical protein